MNMGLERIDTSSHIAENKYVPDNSLLWSYQNDCAYLRLLAHSDGIVKTVCISNGEKAFPGEVKFLKECAVSAFVGHGGWHFQNKHERMPKGPHVKVNDFLADCDGTVKAGDVLWVRLFAFPVSQGEYTITLSFNGETYEYRYVVVDKTLPDPQDYAFDVEYWHHPYNSAEYYGVEPFGEEHMRILREHQLLYKALGGKRVTATIVEDAWGGQTYSKNAVHYPSMIKWIKNTDGSFTFDYTDFDKWVDLNRSIGLTQICCYSAMVWGGALQYYDKAEGCRVKKVVRPVSPAFRKHFGCFFNDFIAHLDSKDMFPDVYLSFDERHNLMKLLDYISGFKNKDGLLFKFSGAFNRFFQDKPCFDRLSSASVSMRMAYEDKKEYLSAVSERNSAGKRTSVYTGGGDFPTA